MTMKFLKHAGQLAKVLGAFGSFLTVILGVIHVFVSSLSLRTRYYPVVEPQRCLLALCSCSSALQTIGASIRWPRGREYEVFDDGKFYKFKESFMADQQRYGWRGELFSLTPGKARTFQIHLHIHTPEVDTHSTLHLGQQSKTRVCPERLQSMCGRH